MLEGHTFSTSGKHDPLNCFACLRKDVEIWQHRHAEQYGRAAGLEAERDRLKAEIAKWAAYCFKHHGNDAKLYNGLADLAGDAMRRSQERNTP